MAPQNALTGIAIISNLTSLGISARYPIVRVHEVTIENIQLDYSNYSAHDAALEFYFLRNLTVSNCTIRNNQVTGMYFFESTAVLLANISLLNNSGVNGGGMALVSNSFILLDSSTILELFNNKAEKFGGGIFSSQRAVFLDYRDGDFSALSYMCIALSFQSPMNKSQSLNSMETKLPKVVGIYMEDT